MQINNPRFKVEPIKGAELADARIETLKLMMMSREADNRENILFRQGRGQFHVSGSGHEAVAGIVALTRPGDQIYGYYRDRALMLALGVPLYEMALGFFAKADSSSGGRQMVNHFSYEPLNIVSSATPTGLQCLPAAGTAWGLKTQQKGDIVFCCIGDASTRQGEFFEALAFSIQEALPIIFVVEDNGYGVSTPTAHLTPLNLGVIAEKFLHVMDGRNPIQIRDEMAPFVEAARAGKGPKVVWLHLDRLTSHTASDDQSKYRDASELLLMQERDPILQAKKALLADGILFESDISQLEEEIRNHVKQIYMDAEQTKDPNPEQVEEHVFASAEHTSTKRLNFEGDFSYPAEEWTMMAAFNHTLGRLLKENEKTILFGEDIEDPKGGVFGLTKGLSTQHPGRVINSPLAEATIAGVAAGLSITGFLPIFELQFIDFIGPAFNQIINQIATLRWRTLGQYKCPLIIYAPCGSFFSGGGPWHSQTNESWLAHAPGLKVYMPSNANDAAQMLYSAAYGEDPVVILLPKNQFQKSVARESELRLYPERAQIKKEGEHVSLVAWGNCVELALAAAQKLEVDGVSAEVIDLCSIVPCDWEALHRSVQKTGRLIVVQEDNKTCSFGQAVISEMCSRKSTWESLYAPPQLVCRGDVHIGFSRGLEQSVLPDVIKILEKVRITLGQKHV